MLEEIDDAPDTPEKIKKKCRNFIENKNYESIHQELINYFKSSAPYFLTINKKDNNTSDISSCTYDEEGARTAIIDIIQELICGSHYEELLIKLKAGNNVSSVCGAIFKCGEPTYSCRECSMDPTCVLCSNCFKKSTHRGHKYKMATSYGGGCCDCGDPEAWKKDYFCDDHAVAEISTTDPLVSEEMRQICFVVFRAILNYCVSTLSIDSDASFPDMDSPDDSAEDLFCTLLYNDETHTFDQVISTLTSIVKCGQKEAVEYVTSIDRDGRAVVKCATFNACVKLKSEIEKKGMRTSMASKIQPLKVAIFHKNTVACQSFALQLLGWFQEFVGLSSTFRRVFAEIVLTSSSSTNYNLRQVLLYDIKLWKTARSAWHRLLIAVMLMEYDNKKELAIMFTKVYTNIMQDFLRDDHYHSFSVVSLSVQLFTVPTIAHHLMAHESAFFKLMHTYYAECIEKYVKNKVLNFPKNAASSFNKRAAYIITDLKYLLTFKPEVWTQDLRLGFLHGIQIVIRLLKCMQGMDAVTRQIGQHMEYEPEWESAFTLHIKLSHLISSIIEWCSTDKVILVKVYRMVLTALNESKFIISNASVEVKELADHSANCLIYDVSTQPISIHLPLTRFLAGLYVHFEKFNLTFDNVSTTTDKPTPEQIIEPVLCTRTMISQVYSGMWRRNGYSLLNQLFFYRNVKCRSEMLDRDVVILQIGASLIQNDEFLIHILNKFNLLNWTEESYKPTFANPEEDNFRQIINMVDEFLELLIIIIGERYVPGISNVTDDDRIKKEIIQQLCIKSLSHSELNKSLNDEYGHENDIENVIDDVAVFDKPANTEKKGVYILKDNYFNDFNMYFYHYTKEEKSKSEEMQRQRHKSKSELICCPPPKLPKLSEAFTMIANLLQCDVMLVIMKAVLRQSADLKSMTFAESHLQKILHLIGYAIQEEDSGNYPFLTFQERSTKCGLLQMMEDLVSSPRVESQRDFLLWTIKKYKDLQSKNNKETEPETESTETTYDDSQMVSEQALKDKRSKLAAQRREQVLAQMAKAQKSFITSNAELFDNIEDAAEAPEEASMDWQETAVEEQKSYACIGPDRKIVHNEAESFTCILCSEESLNNKECMVYPAFVQKSSVLSRYQVTNAHNQLQSLETAIHPSPYVSSCGHVLHATCWQEYFNNEMLKESRRPFRNRNPSIFNIDKNQFLCPLCRFLSNSVLTAIPPLSCLMEPKTTSVCDVFTFEIWHALMSKYMASLESIEAQVAPTDVSDENEILVDVIQQKYQEYVVKYLKDNCQFEDEPAQTGNQAPLNVNQSLKKYSKTFISTACEVAPYPADGTSPSKNENYVVTFLSCAYTIEALEMYMRATDKPLKGEMSVRYEKCVSGLVRLCGFYGRMQLKFEKEADTPSLSSQYYSVLLYARDLYENVFATGEECLLQWDIFGLLVSLLFTTRPVLFAQYPQHLIPCGDSLDHTIFTSIFVINMMKIVLTVNLEKKPNNDQSMETDSDISKITEAKIIGEVIEEEITEEVIDEELSEEANRLLFLYETYNLYVDRKVTTRTHAMRVKIKQQLCETLREQSQTFMRCSSILFQYLTEVPMPDEMGVLGGDTFDVMADYLNINKDLLSYIGDAALYNFMLKCVQHTAIETYRNNIEENCSEEVISIMCPIAPIRQLVMLPDDYSDLINSVSLFTCRNNEREDSRNPTMCLVCGEILCSQTYCCQKELNKVQVGACNYHTEICGAGAGIFLRMRDAEVLLLGQNNGCFLSAPYLDDYGETDQGLRRGNPLHLCNENFKKLHLLWLSHGIHEEIARKTESQSQIFQIQWNHL